MATNSHVVSAYTNSQVMSYGNFGNNLILNMALPLAGETYMEMLNKPL